MFIGLIVYGVKSVIIGMIFTFVYSKILDYILKENLLKIKKIKYCLSVDIFIDKNIIIDRQYFYFSSKFHKSILIIGSFGDNINNCIEI